jgi:hypothetical protein
MRPSGSIRSTPASLEDKDREKRRALLDLFWDTEG